MAKKKQMDAGIFHQVTGGSASRQARTAVGQTRCENCQRKAGRAERDLVKKPE